MLRKAHVMGKRGPKKGHGGRPRKISKEVLDGMREASRFPILLESEKLLHQVESMASFGLTYEQIALILGISETTLVDYEKQSKELYDAHKRGRAKGITLATNALRKLILAGNPSAIYFFLKTQAHWREVQRHEVSGPDGGPVESKSTIDLKELSDDELKKLIGSI